MENIKFIKKADLSRGYFIELNCCMCNEEQFIGASTQKELVQLIKEEGWKELNSDLFAVIGHWCGCDYKEDL